MAGVALAMKVRKPMFAKDVAKKCKKELKRTHGGDRGRKCGS
ncbi:hypothetical protein [Lacrimispora algidixylanolytica]|nr:hypothetical protein [Lacrimispora algidixylanolytica]